MYLLPPIEQAYVMDLRTLGYVEAICRLGTFTAAAHELHVAQPAVSAQIAGLEKRLGTPLFVRTATGARPTEAGLMVAERARRLSAEVNALQEDINSLNGLERGTLRIGATPLLGPVDLPTIAARFRAKHPGVTLRIRTALIADLLAALDHGELDVVLGPLDGITPERHRTTVLHDEHLVLLTTAESATRGLADVRDQPFVCLPEGSGLRRLLDVACAAHGYVPRVDIEVTDPHLIARYIRAGLGVGILAASLVPDDSALHATPLMQAPEHPPLGIITGSLPSRAAGVFIKMIRAD